MSSVMKSQLLIKSLKYMHKILTFIFYLLYLKLCVKALSKIRFITIHMYRIVLIWQNRIEGEDY